MPERRIHIAQKDQTIPERGIEQRTDNPSSPVEGQEWFNTVDNLRKVRIDGQDKIYAFQGENEGQVPYSTIVKDTAELISAVSTGVNNTIYLKVYEYDLTLTAYSLATEKSIRLIGETTAQDSGKRVRIYTDGSHFIKANPTITTITNNATVAAVNGSTTVNLTSGLWATNLTGQYLFLNGKYYLIASNPTQTQIILSAPYTGPSVASGTYYIGYMIKDVIFENIEFVGKNALHIGFVFKNIINPQFINCRFTCETTGMYVKGDFQYTSNALFQNCTFRNYKFDFTNNNYEATFINSQIYTNTTMGTEYFIKLDTQKGTASIPTNFKVMYNTFYGPASFVSIVSAKQNLITGNQCMEVLNNLISIDANSNDNTVTDNIVNSQNGSSTLISINSKYNVISGNRMLKISGYFIDLTSTAQYNTVIGNVLTGGASINDSLPSLNYNRIEDDLSRLGSAPTGVTKDLIDRLNEVNDTLQNKPKVLIQQDVTVDSSLVEETIVYWNDVSNQYEKATATSLNGQYGMLVNKNGTSGDIQFIGIREILTPASGNPSLVHLYNSGYVGQKFYLDANGNLIPDALYTNSGNIYQLSMGVLIDVVGGTLPQFLLLPTEEYKYGTPSSTWQFGQNDSSIKYLRFGSVSTSNGYVNYDPSNRTFFYTKDGKSGEITQPFNNNYLASSVNSYKGTSLLSGATSGSITISEHNSFINGYRKNISETTVLPITGYSGNAYIFDTNDGIVVTSGIVDGALLGLQEQSGGVFLTNRSNASFTFNRFERFNSDDITPSSNSFVELEKLYVPIYVNSGNVDVVVSASTQARVTMQSLYPHQIANIKLRVNDIDVPNTTRKNSLYFISSGEVSYADMNVSKLVNIYSASSGMIKVSVMGRYENGGSYPQVTFNNTNLRVEV